jgi:hypothetical protein
MNPAYRSYISAPVVMSLIMLIPSVSLARSDSNLASFNCNSIAGPNINHMRVFLLRGVGLYGVLG